MHASPRRVFLGRLGAAVTGLAGSSPFAPVPGESPPPEPRRPPLPTSPWDMSWLDRLKNASYRAVFDANVAAMFLDQFRAVYGTRDVETRAVIVARQLGAPLAFGDSVWA